MELSQVLQALRNADAAGDQEAARRLAQIAQQLQSARPPTAPAPAETTVGGGIKELFKGLAPGAIGLVESAATGASALLPSDLEASARKRISEIAGAAKAPFAAAPGYEESVFRKLGEAGGSTLPFFALGPLGLAGRAGMAALGTGAGAGEARVRAEQEGAAADQRGTATALGAVVGVSEMFAPLRIMGRLDEPLKQGISNRLRRIATAGGEEAAQEAAAQIAQNLIAKGVYKPEQAIIEQVGESAAYGGAVGAMAQGLLDLALGRRAKGVTTKDEITQAREEADAAAAAEKARKESPEYAQQFVADYDARKQAFLDAKAELKRPGKDATPDVWAAYKDQKSVVDALDEDLKKDAREYNRLRPTVQTALARAAEDARKAQLSPFEYAFGEVPGPAVEAQPVAEKQWWETEPAAPVKKETVVDYATQRLALAQDQLPAPTVADYVDYIMQDPTMAAGMLKSRVRLPGLTRAENETLLDGLKLKFNAIKEQEKAATELELQQRAEDLKAQRPGAGMSAQQQQILNLYEAQATDLREGEPNFDYLDPIFEQAVNRPPTIKISDKVQPLKNAPAIRERIEALMMQADQADKDYRTARAARQPDAALSARRKGSAALQEIESLSKEGNEYSKEFLAARKGQNEALAGLQDVVEQLRTEQTLGGRNKEMAASTEQTLTNQAGRLRAQLITNALQEAALHRRAAGQSQITQDEAIKAASKLFDTVESLLERAKTKPEKAEYEEVIVQPAQMRGTKIVRPAVTERRRVQPQAAELSEQAAAKKKAETAAAAELQKVDEKLQQVRSEIVRLREERAASKSTEAIRRLDALIAGQQNKLGPLNVQQIEAQDKLDEVIPDAAKQLQRIAQNRQAVERDIADLVQEKSTAKDKTALAKIDAYIGVLKNNLAQWNQRETVARNALNKELNPQREKQAGEIYRELQKQVEEARKQLIAPPKGEAVRVEPALKTQFAETEAAKVAEARGETAETLGGELRRRTEFVRDKMAKMGVMRPMARDVLNKAADVMDAGRANKALLDAVEPVVDAITSKRQVTQTDLRAVSDALKASEPTAAEQQAQGQQALNLLFEEPGQRPRLVQKDLGFIRKSFENFENAPAIKKARLAVDQAKKMAKKMQAQREQEDEARLAAAKKAAKAQERRVLDLAGAVRRQRGDLQQAVYNAIEAERQALADAQKIASAPLIKTAEQAVADAEAALKALETRLETLTENIQFPWMESVKKEKARVRGRIGYQQTVVQNAKNELAQVVADSQVRYENAAVIAKANQDSLVQFERKALEKFEKRLEKLRKEATGPSPALAAAQKAADEQRARVATEEKNARDAAEKSNKDQRDLEQRLLKGLGLPGVKRVAGETVEIEAEKDAQLTKALAEAYERSKEAQDAIAGIKPDIPQVPRATGPVARGLRTQVGKLTQARTTKQPEVETAVAEANVLAAERAAKQPEKTKAEAAKEAAKRQTQMREGKERLESTIRGQLADLNIRIDALKKAIKPNPELIKDLEQQRQSLQRDLVAARQDIEKEGELEKKAQRELKKEERAQAKQEAERGAQEGLFRTTAKAGPSLKEQTVKKIADKVVADWTVVPEVVVVADESGLPEKIRKQATAQGVTGTIPGVYDPSTKTTYLVSSNLKDAEDVVLTIAHEITGHFGLREVLGRSYAPTMQRLYEGNKLVKQRADEKMDKQKFLDRNTAVEEVLADMAETGATPQERNILQRVYDYFKRWLKAKFPSLNIDTVTDNDVRQVVANARRYVLEGPAAAGITPSVDSAAFKKWFGDSKVVGPDGKPLVVYHGTDKDFATFDAEKPKASGAMHGKGFYFADAAHASGYADATEGGGLVMPVYLRMENPFLGELTQKDVALLRKEMPEFEEAYKKFVEEEGAAYTPSIERLGVLSGNRNEFIQKALRTAGYDGRIVSFEPKTPWKDPDTEYVVFEPTQVKSAIGNVGTYDIGNANILYRTAEYASPEMEAAGKKLDPFVAKQRSTNEKIRAAAGGFLGLETMLVDRFAGFERLSKYLPEHLGTQMMYYLRMYDQRMNMVSQAVANGAPSLVEKTRKDGKTERLIEAKEGPNIKRTVEILRDANPMVGNAEAVNRLFTAYMAGIRADNKGFDTLNFGEGVTPEMLKDALSVVNNNPALKKIFDAARSEYNAYNRNLVEFLVETGAISRDVANRLMAENDYIPFYRERGGVAELLIGKEAPIKIGSIKEQPYLQQLVGGDQPILDFLTSSVQNTNFLVDMGMRNLATKNAIYELVDLNAAKIVGGTPSGTNVVKFKDKGKDKYAVLATETVRIGNKEFETGVPADILVKGMEGVPTQMPALLRAFALPAQLLRKGVTLSPLYVARQVFRDSLAAPILAGANFTPVIGALRQIGKPTKGVLERRGITGGQQFTGTSDDLSMILRDVAEGKPGWMSLLAKAEGMAMSADALTRRAQYNSYIEQGLSEMEATLMSLESMNFSKRGASPSIQIANSMIPFFNAQIQGLNVMYKALTGKMPMNDKLKLREKLLQRGGLMAAASMIYAIMMQDDEAYKNAEADQKYANWFVRLPGVDEPVRIPIPFEIGYIFKALPEALVNTMASQEGGEQALKALRQIVIQTIPGGSSYGIPQALKPAIEAGLGKSFYTGRDILSAREKGLLPEEQFRANTAEISKLIGQTAGVSPIVLENLVRGYTGTMGLAFLQAISLGVPPGEGPEKAVKRLSEYPIVGGAFQPNDAGAIVNSTYERMNDALKVKDSYDKMVKEGRMAEANALIQRRSQEFMQSELAQEFKNNMNQIIAAERAIQASSMSGEEKRKQLDELRKLKIAVAKEIRDVADKTIRLSFSL